MNVHTLTKRSPDTTYLILLTFLLHKQRSPTERVYLSHAPQYSSTLHALLSSYHLARTWSGLPIYSYTIGTAAVTMLPRRSLAGCFRRMRGDHAMPCSHTLICATGDRAGLSLLSCLSQFCNHGIGPRAASRTRPRTPQQEAAPSRWGETACNSRVRQRSVRRSLQTMLMRMGQLR